MLDSTISTRLKSLFDRIYLSRNVFERLLDLINDIGDKYDVTSLTNRANEFLNSIDSIINDNDIVELYKNYILNITSAKDAYVVNFDIVVAKITTYYTTLMDNFISTIEAIRVQSTQYAAMYKNDPEIAEKIKPYQEFIGSISTIDLDLTNFGVLGVTKNSIVNNHIYIFQSLSNPANFIGIDADGFTCYVSTDSNPNGFNSHRVTKQDIQSELVNRSGYPVLTVDSMDITGKSFSAVNNIFTVYVNCTIISTGAKVFIPIVFSYDDLMGYGVKYMSYADSVNKRYASIGHGGATEPTKYLLYKSGNLIEYFNNNYYTTITETVNLNASGTIVNVSNISNFIDFEYAIAIFGKAIIVSRIDTVDFYNFSSIVKRLDLTSNFIFGIQTKFGYCFVTEEGKL